MDLDAFMMSAGKRLAILETAVSKISPEAFAEGMEALKTINPDLLAKIEPTVEDVGHIISELRTLSGQVVNAIDQLQGLAERVAALEAAKNEPAPGQH